eukprot:CAMPEP_0114601882 /NCGR_PEP_ID=MMETSP0125-20121206/24501_1 /TAXON_ID=485358 ORGANISM="Aristerostoma sp., Strain ATCC 50986" /NCGR_SAMPLE_ID=MMETSP0125 /ASSEMBLY_ACC=CAM_ASM_000245 /LENGTH=49 /DNA_ID= /DNA_START= /DNA_END= /DNA_ORIENTATION=
MRSLAKIKTESVQDPFSPNNESGDEFSVSKSTDKFIKNRRLSNFSKMGA